MNTLQLNAAWDLTLDAAGNIALLTGDAAIAQDVASACRLFFGELWYDTAQGVPYFGAILGYAPNPEFIKAQLVLAALTVPGVTSAKCFLDGLTDRNLSGQVQVMTAATVAPIIVPISMPLTPGEFTTDVSSTDGPDLLG